MLLNKLFKRFGNTPAAKPTPSEADAANRIPTIISNSDAAQYIYDRLGMEYRSPTIGVWFHDGDYLEMIKDIPAYTSCPLEDISANGCVTGRLAPDPSLYKPVTLNFYGYASFADAAAAWEKRCALVDPSNTFIIWEFADDKYDCSWYMSLFSVLPGRTAALTRKKYPEMRNCHCISAENTGERWLDKFDYVSFLDSAAPIPLPESRLTPDQVRFLWQINEIGWKKQLRARNRNMNPTILAGNCAPGFIYHNLGLRFNSPTINLWMHANDFFALAAHLREYAASRMEEITDAGVDYPVGRLIPDDTELPALTLYFQHYHSYEEARDKWFERYARINYDNICVIQEFYNIRYDVAATAPAFNALPYKKIAMLHKPSDALDRSTVFHCGPEDGGEFPAGYIFERDGITGRRFMDEFDYVSFLNE